MTINSKSSLGIFLLFAFGLFAIATWLRLSGTTWDHFAGLHPDERHLLFVLSEMIAKFKDLPESSVDITTLWFATGQSPLDPHLHDQGYVYGELPIISMALLALHLDISSWPEMLMMTRNVTALLDGLTILAVIMLAFEMTGRPLPAVLAGLLYASAPTSQQLANFFTVDPWLTTAFAWCGLLLWRLVNASSFRQAIILALLTGGAIGVALACKLTALLLALPVIATLLHHRRTLSHSSILLLGLAVISGMAISYRLLNPFAFNGPDILGIMPSGDFLGELLSAHNTLVSEDFPPNWQWTTGYGPLHFFRDFILFGSGPVVIGLLLLGLRPQLLGIRSMLLLSLSLPILIYAVFSQASALRYATPSLPALSVLCGLVVVHSHFPNWLAVATSVIGIWWGSGVYALHSSVHPRIAASRWIWTLPAKTVIANETDWDEALPVAVVLPGESERRWSNHSGHFNFVNLQLTRPDTSAKAANLAAKLNQSNYLIVSSGRQKLVMPRLSERFPVTTTYYRMLDSGTLCFELVWEDIRGYRPAFLAVHDLWAQEPWRVYDHPMVQIYRKQSCFDKKAILETLLTSLSPSPRNESPGY